MAVSRRLRIVNEKGLHARASAKFSEVCERHEARATVSKDGIDAGGDSIMGLLMLGAARGSQIEVTCEGSDETALMDALEALVAGRFGEPM